ncbi:MAG: 50S ribosomal protein L25 [Bacteroidales bacterium]|nr:50S ribosomal protein L25 [Bacteroidales bacterium]
MKTVSLSGSLRENVGKKDTKALRKAEMVPCVMYGSGIDQVHFATSEKSFKKILFTPETYIIDFDINGKTYKTILQDVQYHPVTDKVLHADFLVVTEDKPITVVLPVALQGSAVGVMRGGKPKMGVKKVKVCGLIKDLPDYINVNISNVNINGAIKVKDLNIENVTPVTPDYTVIFAVNMARGASISTDEEEAAAE